MRDVGARSRPEVADHVSDTERQECAEPRCDDTVPGVDRAPLAANEEKHREQGHEGVLGVQREEAKRVLHAVVRGGEVVERLEEIEIDVTSVIVLSDCSRALGPAWPQPYPRRRWR